MHKAKCIIYGRKSLKKTIFVRNLDLFISILSLLFSAVVYLVSKSVLFAVVVNFLVMNLYTVFFKRNHLSHRELISTILWISHNSIISCLVIIILINYALSNDVFLFIPIMSIMFFLNFLIIVYSKIFLRNLTAVTGVEYKSQAFKLMVVYVLFLVLKILISDLLINELYRSWKFKSTTVINLVICSVISIVLCQVIYTIFRKKVNALLYYSLIIPHVFIPYEYYFYLFFLVLSNLFE